MTNAPLDIQPALRPLNVLVRAGRLTKFKGQVASIAPGLSVVATAVLLAGGADQAAAQALNACGPDEVGQDTVTCDARNYAEGITYTESDGLTLILPDATNFGARSDGVNVTGTGEGNVSVRMRDGTVNTSDASVKALYARARGDGAATVQMDGGTVTTVGGGGFDSSARALHASVENLESEATATVSMTGGVVETFGSFSSGLWAWTNGTGEAIAQMDGGTVTTDGGQAHGI